MTDTINYLNEDDYKKIIQECFEIFSINNLNVDYMKFKTAFILEKFLKNEIYFNNLYDELLKTNNYYSFNLNDKKYRIFTLYSDIYSVEEAKENLNIFLEEIDNFDNKYDVLLLTDYLVDNKDLVDIKIIDYEEIVENIMKLKATVDNFILDFESYEEFNMSKCDNVSLCFFDLKKLVDKNRKAIKNKDAFGYNLRFDVKDSNQIIKNMTKTLINNPQMFKTNNGLTIGCEEMLFKPESKEIILKNASIINGQQNIVVSERNFEKLKDNIYIACKIIEYKNYGRKYLQDVAKINNSQNKVKSKEMNSNLEEYYRISTVLIDNSINKEFKLEFIHKEGQEKKDKIKLIDKQEAFSLLQSFKKDICSIDELKNEKILLKMQVH